MNNDTDKLLTLCCGVSEDAWNTNDISALRARQDNETHGYTETASHRLR